MRSSIIAGLLIFCLCGCESEEVSTFRSLAPDGGNGTKSYNYPDGRPLKQEVWSDYKIVAVSVFDQGGKTVFTSLVQNERLVNVRLTETGEIIEIFESKGFEKDGLCVLLEDLRVKGYEIWISGERTYSFDINK